MAKATFKMPDEFLHKVTTLAEKTDEIVPRVLESGGEIVLESVKDNLDAVLSGQSTGQLSSALGLSPAKQNRDGNWDVKVGFAENRTDGVSNAMLANILEYGKHGQPPKPFLKPAVRSSQSAVLEKMSSKLDEEIQSL
jgi:HK97 gp10 family phage protein